VQSLIPACILTLIAVFADSIIKKAALMNSSDARYWLIAGIIIYGATGVGWFYVMKHMPLYAVGVVFSLVSTLTLVLVGVFFFHETLSTKEMIGIALGVASLIIIGWQSAT
jgi:drug/metabolite transporter (DMT)-like permease